MTASMMLARVFGESGFSTDLALNNGELEYLRSVVSSQWLDTIGGSYPALRRDFERIGIERYHELADLVDHKALWPKTSRLLPEHAVRHMQTMGFFRALEDSFGDIAISDEEPIGWPAVYWRLVRPLAASDYGPLHADAWFWELGNGVTPQGRIRVKVWIPLYVQPGLNGLRVVPGSHRQTWRYHGEMRDGYRKPCLDEDEESMSADLLPTAPGRAVVFHDLLIHGGAYNRAENTRVSMEFTLFVHELMLAIRMPSQQAA
jgi:hypothetical protein